MIPIIRWELRQRRMFIVWWCLGIIVLVSVLMAIYPSIHQQAAQLNQILQQMPESIRALRGGDSDITSPTGYLNAELFYITLPLLFIIMSINLGGSLLGRDEEDRTLELLLARPISRGTVLAAKALSGIAIVAIAGAAAMVTTALLARIIGMDINSGHLLLTTALTVLFSLSFGAITFALTAASVISRKLATAAAVIASFGGYILESLSSLSDYIKTPATFFPYHYFVPRDMLAGMVSQSFVTCMAIIFIGAIVVAYTGFRRRDIG